MNNLEYLRAPISIATASNPARLSSTEQHRFRRNTAKWLDESFFKMLSACEVENVIECGAHEAGASSRFMRSGEAKNRSKKIRASVGKIKSRLTNSHGSVLALFTHRIAAKPGSGSSQKGLEGNSNTRLGQMTTCKIEYGGLVSHSCSPWMDIYK